MIVQNHKKNVFLENKQNLRNQNVKIKVLKKKFPFPRHFSKKNFGVIVIIWHTCNDKKHKSHVTFSSNIDLSVSLVLWMSLGDSLRFITFRELINCVWETEKSSLDYSYINIYDCVIEKEPNNSSNFYLCFVISLIVFMKYLIFLHFKHFLRQPDKN